MVCRYNRFVAWCSFRRYLIIKAGHFGFCHSISSKMLTGGFLGSSVQVHLSLISLTVFSMLLWFNTTNMGRSLVAESIKSTAGVLRAAHTVFWAAPPPRRRCAHSKSPLAGACMPVQTRNVRLCSSVEDNTSRRLLYYTATVQSGPEVWFFILKSF